MGVREWLQGLGWRKDTNRMGWVGPQGTFLSDTDVMHAEIEWRKSGSKTFMGAIINSGSDDGMSARWSPYDKLRMRLGLQPGEAYSLDHVHVATGIEQVHVFIVHHDEAVILSDPISLFPSDTLIAKVQLFIASVK